MDHLPKPQQRGRYVQKLTFPLRCDPNGYDNAPLETYPERRGFRLNYWSDLEFANILTLLDGSRPSVEQSTVLLQERLYFGLLSVINSIYGTEFNGHDYVMVSEGTTVLSLEKLPQHANIWFSIDGERPEAERRQHFREIENHQMRALRFLTNNFTEDSHGSISFHGVPDNVVSEDSRIAVESNLEMLLLALHEAITNIDSLVYFRKHIDRTSSGPKVVSRSIHHSMDSLQWVSQRSRIHGSHIRQQLVLFRQSYAARKCKRCTLSVQFEKVSSI